MQPNGIMQLFLCYIDSSTISAAKSQSPSGWVPYHTVLGVHELFLMEAVHSRKDWTEKQKFFAARSRSHESPAITGPSFLVDMGSWT